MKKIAVVTPYYKIENKKLERCCESVASQTIKCDHILVGDGERQPLPGKYNYTHIFLPFNVGNSGATPRGIGGIYAFAQDYDVVSFLDADNWYDSVHLEMALNTMLENKVDLVFAKRNIIFADGEILKNEDPEDANGGHVDTNCYIFSKRVAYLMSHMALYPKSFGVGEDRYLKKIIEAMKIKTAHIEQKTVWYETHWALHYKLANKKPVAPLRRPERSIGRNWESSIFEQRTGLKVIE